MLQFAADLNQRARTHRLNGNEAGPTVLLADGNQASVGDVIAEADSGEVDQVSTPHPRVHVSHENALKDVITRLEPNLFKAVTGLTVDDFNLLVSLNVFNSSHMNQAVFAFRRYEDSSLSYTGIESHEGLRHFGLYDTVVDRDR